MEILAGTVVSGDWTSLRADNTVDNSYLQIKSTLVGTMYTVEWYGEAATGLLPNQVSQLSLTYDGHYSRFVGQNLFMYDFVSGGWVVPGNTYMNISVVDTTVGPITMANPARYISPEGRVRAKVYASSLDNTLQGYGDFIKFTITK